MENHVTAVGAIIIGLSILGILVGGFIFVLLSGIGFIASDEEAAVILPTIGIIIGVFLSLLSIPGIVGGLALFKHKEWARILILAVSALHLINFPIGTAAGIYSIWVLVQPETIKLFNPVVPAPQS
jgi:hypothetical protein